MIGCGSPRVHVKETHCEIWRRNLACNEVVLDHCANAVVAEIRFGWGVCWRDHKRVVNDARDHIGSPITSVRAYRMTSAKACAGFHAVEAVRYILHNRRTIDVRDETMPTTVTIRIPSLLRHHSNGERIVMVQAATMGSALDALFAQHSTLRDSLIPQSGNVFEATSLFVNDNEVSVESGLATELADGDTVTILPAMAGGSVLSSDGLRAVLTRSGAERAS